MASNVYAPEGYLQIDNKDDRSTVASILFKNGYKVSTSRRKKNGKTNSYYVHYKYEEEIVPETEGEAV